MQLGETMRTLASMGADGWPSPASLQLRGPVHETQIWSSDAGAKSTAM
jgi:hypothetical protein